MSLWGKLFGKGNEGKGSRDYAEEKAKASSSRSEDRLEVARDSGTRPEILYYMAKDPDPKVRMAVAGNQATPLHVSGALAEDADQDVRLSLAHRLVGLLPDLSEDRQSQLYDFAAEALGTLALDEVLKIRLALSSTLKDCVFAPPQVVRQLAVDVEREVSEPILRFCIALSDEDLLAILRSHPEDWVAEAIAARPCVSEEVSGAVVDTQIVPAGVTLIGNAGAAITPGVMGEIVRKSRGIPAWQKPLAMRKNLSPALARELAGFVDRSVRNVLMDRTDFGPEVQEEISNIFARRMDMVEGKENGDETPEDRVRRMAGRGELTDDVLTDALAVRDREFVILALAALSKASRVTVDKVIAMNAPKPLVALCWKAGLSMRTAFRMETELARIPSGELVYPRGGTDYPMTEEELVWQLEFLGFKK